VLPVVELATEVFITLEGEVGVFQGLHVDAEDDVDLADEIVEPQTLHVQVGFDTVVDALRGHRELQDFLFLAQDL